MHELKSKICSKPAPVFDVKIDAVAKRQSAAAAKLPPMISKITANPPTRFGPARKAVYIEQILGDLFPEA